MLKLRNYIISVLLVFLFLNVNYVQAKEFISMFSDYTSSYPEEVFSSFWYMIEYYLLPFCEAGFNWMTDNGVEDLLVVVNQVVIDIVEWIKLFL